MTGKKTIRIGVDTGGTFTDILCLDDRGLRVGKLRSVPEDPSRAILDGIRALVGDDLGSLSLEITHGSTVATNAVLERKGARVALLTTAGFEDVLRIGRQTRPELYNFNVRRPEPLVDPAHTFGIRERLAADGSVLLALDPSQLAGLILDLKQLEIESVAVCFLHSYANPLHEQQAAAILRSAGFRVSASHEILPEYREYERWATTAVNAYVAPLMARYLDRLGAELSGGSTSQPAGLRIMQSNGGSISASRAGSEAVQTILSGPAAGVIGAQALGAASGFTRLLTFDMGGTSTDVSLLNGSIATTNDSIVGDLPVRLPVLDIHTVGAGGGSVAWIDSGGSLRVGPRSAGANPGPACFGLGDELTVTDANLLLGRLDPAFFLGGRMSLDLARPQRLAETFAARLKLTRQALAEGILSIANANMERALRVVSVQRGFDPRDFALLAFGGAGGLHACDLADSLEITTVLVPEHSGVLSALGMLLADVARDYSVSVLLPMAALTPELLLGKLAPLGQRAQTDLAGEGFSSPQVALEATAAIRYKGQAFEVDIPFSPEPHTLAASFHLAHARLYGYSDPNRPTELVQLRLRAIGRTDKPTLTQVADTAPKAAGPPAITRRVTFRKRWWNTPVFHRDSLTPGHGGKGPAMMLTGESTVIVPPGWTWQIDGAGTLQLRREGKAKHAH